MKTFQEFISEGVDPLEHKLSGGRGDNPAITGARPADDKHQITDHLKPQDAHTDKFLKQIKPHIDVTVTQNSPNIPANNGKKLAKETK